MIIQYDTRPDATIDEKLRSLIESIQLALGEIGIRESNNVTSQTINVEAVLALVRELADDVRSYDEAIASLGGRLDTAEGRIDAAEGNIYTLNNTTIPALDTRIDALEARWTAPAAPTTDGAYKLTVTVTDGVPVYTWESA
jgi:hypothetical protein